MKVSLIIAVYKDIQALEIIFDSLINQTYKNFEVIVAEDGNSKEMKEFIQKSKNIYDFKIIHTTQEDKGVRKSHSQNNAIKVSNGKYLIFIDGDCPLYSTFIENHLLLSDKNGIVTGRRVNLGPKFSQKLREKEITPYWLEKNFIRLYKKIKDDSLERHTEEGFYIKPNSFFHKILKLRKKKLALLGCNMSMYKDAMLDINGFDEELGNSAYASDSDLEWRFEGLGYKIISGRFMVNQFHLYHQRKDSDFDRKIKKIIELNKKYKLYKCKNGLF